MESLGFALGAVLPVFALIGLGTLVRRVKILDDNSVGRLSKLVFTVALPAMIFQVIRKADIAQAWDTRTALAFVLSIPAALLIALAIAKVFKMSSLKTGTFVICAYRSNTVILGLAVLESAYGADKIPAAGILAALAILSFNPLAVINLTLPHHKGFGPAQLKRLLLRLISNPLIIAAVLALLWNLLENRTGAKIPELLDKPLTWLRQMCLPVALITAGASLHSKSISENPKQVLAAALVKLVLHPVIALLLVLLLGVTGMNMAAVIICAAAPTAVATYAMVRSMDGDHLLASAAITTSTALSVATLSLWLMLIRYLLASG
jgi:predicted permease